MNYEQIFKNIDDILWKEAGCSNELDYVEQTSWILFLKYLDDYENDRADAMELQGKEYNRILKPEFRWDSWACPKNADGSIDIHSENYKTGPDLSDFVNNNLFPFLQSFANKDYPTDTLEYKIGEIFKELKNKIASGFNLREILDYADGLHFQSTEDKHEMSHLYESKIHKMGNAGRNGGEYYTPRPLIRTIVKVVNPKIGETVYDGACGSAGFLCEAFKYMDEKADTVDKKKTLQKSTFFGREKKGLAYIIGIMNMIFHGVEAPDIQHTNTLSIKASEITNSERKDVVLANPPFGGKERSEIQGNFNIKTGETAYLFMQHFIKMLKAGGRAGIVIKNTFLSNTDNASVSLRKELLENCNLHTVLDLPSGVFTGAGVKTVVLFFDKGRPTEKIWYYQLNLDRNLGKTNPLSEKDLEDFVTLQKTFAISPNSWTINIADLDPATLDLSVKNPNRKEETSFRQPDEIIAEMQNINKECGDILQKLV